MRSVQSLVLGVSLFVWACGGSQKPAEEPEGESSAEAPEESKDESASDADASTAAADAEGADEPESTDKGKGKGKTKAKGKAEGDDAAAKAEAPSDTSGPTVKRTPKDLLTAPDVIFMFSFNASDVKQGAEERCRAKSKGDPKKNADCMTKEKAKVAVDGMRFKQEKGRWYWMLVKRKGKTLVNLHKIPVEFENETDTSVVLKPAGKDEGTKRGKGPGETKVEVPNEYQISIDDPSLGTMVYEAKIGLEGEQPR